MPLNRAPISSPAPFPALFPSPGRIRARDCGRFSSGQCTAPSNLSPSRSTFPYSILYTCAMKYDILAVGDPTIDCFIRLKDARATCDINDENCQLCVRFGDKVPYEFALEVPAVGNAANAAVACARLGLSAAFSGSVGDDERGTRIIEAFRSERVATELIRTDRKSKRLNSTHSQISY